MDVATSATNLRDALAGAAAGLIGRQALVEGANAT